MAEAAESPASTLQDSLITVNELTVQVQASHLPDKLKAKLQTHLKKIGDALKAKLAIAQAVDERLNKE